MSPDDFIFTIKVPQYITNYKKLNDFGVWWEEFEVSIKELKHKLGVLLFVFCNKFVKNKQNIQKLETVKGIIPKDIKCAFEFRHNSWFIGGVEEKERLFEDNWTIAITHTTGMEPLNDGYNFNDTELSNFVYIRLHGTSEFCHGSYGYENIKEMLDTFVPKGKDAYIYSNVCDTMEYFDYKSATLEDYKKHKPNIEENLIISLYGKPMLITNKQMIPSAVYDMLILAKIEN